MIKKDYIQTTQGYIMWSYDTDHPDRAHIEWLHVRIDRRRKGIGQELVRRLKAKHPRLSVQAIDPEGLADPTAFYEACGFHNPKHPKYPNLMVNYGTPTD